MSEPLVLALVAPDVPESALAALLAGFEEESVPLVVERGEGTATSSAGPPRRVRCSASASASTGARPVPCSPAAPSAAYLEAPLADVRAFAQDAARIAGRRPLRRPAT